MKINRPCANGTSTGQGYAGLAITRQQWPKNQNRCPHFSNKIIRRIILLRTATHGDNFAIARHINPKMAKQTFHRNRIGKFRHIFQYQWRIGDQTKAKQRQGGIFGTVDDNIAMKWLAAINFQTIHAPASLCFWVLNQGFAIGSSTHHPLVNYLFS